MRLPRLRHWGKYVGERVGPRKTGKLPDMKRYPAGWIPVLLLLAACYIWEFVRAVNAAGHCGYFDWRIPSRNELMSISDLRKADNPPTANLDYFPHMQADEYWTGFDYGTQYQSAWAWNFFYGHDRVDWKSSTKFVRLVRGNASDPEEVKE
jgi:hypothetical protein